MAERMQNLYESIRALGTQRLLALGGAALLTMSLVILGAFYMNKPTYETLYVGLERDDVNRMGIVLSEAGISYDVDENGTTFLVAAGQTARARMILAEKNLPGSAESGYELFDDMGSLGLTSFMQEMTRVRALEGEIARSIQAVNGVKAARVHIVMPEQSGFRSRDRKPTASVLLRSSGADLQLQANGIRQLVAAAVPGLSRSDVTVLDSSGRLLSAGDDEGSRSVGSALELEQRVENDIERKIADALRPSVGEMNYRVAVRAELDTDRRQEERTIFDPDSRVERSVQVTRTKDMSNEARNESAATVDQNIPTENNNEETANTQSTEESERREETTNYEINSTRIATVSNGYRIRRLSIAVVLNESSLVADGADAVDAGHLEKISGLISVAAGLDEERGDRIDVTAIEFLAPDDAFSAVEEGMMERYAPYFGTLVQGLIFAIVAFAALWMIGRPLVRAATSGSPRSVPALAQADAGGSEFELPSFDDADPASLSIESLLEGSSSFGGGEPASPSEIQQRILDRMAAVGDNPRDRLAAMLEIDPERTVLILRRWLRSAQDA